MEKTIKSLKKLILILLPLFIITNLILLHIIYNSSSFSIFFISLSIIIIILVFFVVILEIKSKKKVSAFTFIIVLLSIAYFIASLIFFNPNTIEKNGFSLRKTWYIVKQIPKGDRCSSIDNCQYYMEIARCGSKKTKLENEEIAKGTRELSNQGILTDLLAPNVTCQCILKHCVGVPEKVIDLDLLKGRVRSVDSLF